MLVTTLLDPVLYPKKKVGELYLKRWHVELDLRSIKCVLQMEVLRCKTPDMVVKEIWVHLLAYNLIRGVIVKAASAHGKEPRNVSFKGALQTMTAFLPAWREADPSERKRLMKVMLEAIAAHEVGDRPGRSEPRVLKRRPKPQKLMTEPRETTRNRLQAKVLR